MIRLCSMCLGLNIDTFKKSLLEEEIEDDCIYECGSEFTAYVKDELITANDEQDFIDQSLEVLSK
jgi:hypothetical protein